MIKKIFHIADLHLRNYDRHDEFQKSIDAFLDGVSEASLQFEEGLILIAGDLFETQEQVSNEANNIMVQTLKKCLAVHPTLIIIGNHDLPKNRTRMDAITPLVDAINSNDLLYSKKSEVFDYKNVTFVHYCFLDDFAVQFPTKNPERKYIGLYHAPLQNCENPLNWVFNSKMAEHKTSVKLFKGCDVVLMGDIHYPQEIKGDGYSAYYVGSLYQQNFGEYVEKHGYGVLEIPEMFYTFVPINNGYGKYKCILSDANTPIEKMIFVNK